MSIARDIVAAAEKDVGVVESPPGSNTSPRIREMQANTILDGTGWAWCAAAVETWWEEGGLTDHPANPSTYWMYQKAKSRGEVSATPKVGGAIIWPGKHVGLVVGIGNGVVQTIEGNSGNMVARRVRAIAGAEFINPKGLGEVEDPDPPRYWLEDVGGTIEVLGGPWRREAYQAKAWRKMEPAARRAARRIKDADGRYWIVKGHKRYGPWASQECQVASRKILEARLGRRLRPFRTGGSPAQVSGAVDGIHDSSTD